MFKRSVTAIFLMLILFGISTRSQPNIDTLWGEYLKESNDSVRISIMLEIADSYSKVNPDTSIYYYNKAISEAEKSDLNIRPFALHMASSLTNIGSRFRKESEFSKSIHYQDLAVDILTEFNDSLGIAKCYQNIGNVHVNLGNFEKAFQYYFDALNIFEETNNRIGVADIYNNIGTVHKEQGSYSKALEYHNMSSEAFSKLLQNADTSSLYVIKRGLSYSYNNIGIIKWNQGEYEKSIEFYKKSLDIKLDIDDKSGVAQGYNNIAIAYCSQERYENGIDEFKKSIEIYEEIKNRNGLAMVYGNISYLYIILADDADNEYSKNEYLERALPYGHKAYNIATEIKALPHIASSAEYLKDAYSKLGRYKEAFRFAQVYINNQNEMFSKDKTTALAEMSTKYETEKKQLEIDNITKEKEIFRRRVFTQRIIIFFSLLVIAIVLSFSFVLVRLLNQKKRANTILTEQNEEILQQKEEIVSQIDEIEEQSRVLMNQKNEIEQLYHIAIERKNLLEKQRENIDDSIRYAKFIQSAVLPDLKTLFSKEQLSDTDYFLLFRPKDIVSGDFYWVVKKANWLVVTVADCTGHGIPGAFMSMLGVSFLNEIVLNNNNIDPAGILNEMRSYIISALKQRNFRGTQRDGMEMSIASINLHTRECLWAGASNPLWIVKANPNLHADDVVEIKPDLMPVATHIRMDAFSTHQLQLEKGDRLYFFSDGYPDQFGGPNGKKFNMHSAFKRLIAETAKLPMQEQGQELETVFDTWVNYRGRGFEQIDDVTVLGIMV